MTDVTVATGTPGWKPLISVAMLVVAAHVLLLQASPAHLGLGTSPDDANGKTFQTRRIDIAKPTAGDAVAAPALPQVAKKAQNKPKKAPSPAKSQQIPVQPPPETVAFQETPAVVPPDPEAPAVPGQPLEITANATLPEAGAAAAVVPPDAEAPAVVPPDPEAPAVPGQRLEITANATLPEAGAAAAAATGPKTKPVGAISLPGSTRLRYKMVGMAKNINYRADAELAWKTDGDNYQALMKVSAFLVGSRSMTSVGKVTSSGLAPTRFTDKFRTELAAHFEADKGKITFSANTPDAKWIKGAQDRVSVFLQLSGMLAARPEDFPPGSNITFLTIGPRDADTWTFVIEAEETLSLMGSQMPTLKLTRKPRKEFDQRVEIWFAPSLGYLPVRNRITQPNGDFIDQQVVEVAKSL